MRAPFVSIKTGWLVLAAAGLGLAAGFLLRPDRDPSSAAARPDGSPQFRLPNHSPLGRPRALPQTEARLEALRRAGSPSRQIAAALAFAEITSVEEIRDLLENSHRFPSHSAEEVAIGTLLKRWLELDAAGAVEYCHQKQSEFLPGLLTNWGQDHPAEATAWVQALPSGMAQKTAWLGLCTAVASGDPEKAWEMLANTPGQDPHMGGWELQSSIKAIVGQDLEKALASLETMPPALVASAQRAIAEQLMKKDPIRAWAWVCQLPVREAAIAAALEVSLKADPAQALVFMKSLPAGELLEMLPRRAYDWGAANTKAFVALLRQDPEMEASIKQQIAQDIFSPHISLDPATALEMISLMSGPFQKSSMEHSVGYWARNDPAASRAWVESLPEGPLRTIGMDAQARFDTKRKAIDPANPTNPMEAFNRANVPLDLVTEEQFGKIMDVGQVEDNHDHRRELLFKIGTVKPTVAAAWLESTPLDAKTGPMAAQFSAHWAGTDPTAAAAWVLKLPPGNLAVNAAANVARQYHRYAPAEALAWLPQLPPGPVQDAARQAMTGP